MSDEDFEILVGSTIAVRLDEAELGLVVSAVYLGPHPKVPPDLAMVVTSRVGQKRRRSGKRMEKAVYVDPSHDRQKCLMFRSGGSGSERKTSREGVAGNLEMKRA